jgi:post-segregation antitoxin (ccd killing protein)
MTVAKLSVSVDRDLAERAKIAAAREGETFSAWLAESIDRRLRISEGLAAVAEWELRHGAFSAEELASAGAELEGMLRGEAA